MFLYSPLRLQKWWFTIAIKKVITVAPRGFCAGVDRAIKVVEDALDIFGLPVYVKHEIVHNKHVVADLAEKGAVTVENPHEAPAGSVIIFSAHGSPPGHYEAAKKRNLRIIDATCPLVTKVHLEVVRFARQGYTIIYIGHKGHVEGIGVMGELPAGEVAHVENPQEVEQLAIGNPEKLIYLTQTTLSIDETLATIAALKKKYPQIRDPPREDICYATTNRQKAIKELAMACDVILVVGSVTSSNSQRLLETAKAQGVAAYLVDDVSAVKELWLAGKSSVGISAGASAPDYLVQEIVSYFASLGAAHEELVVQKEGVQFIPPRELVRAREERA